MENRTVTDQTEPRNLGLGGAIAARFPVEAMEKWGGALAIVLVMTFFLASWWNRYLAPTFGGELFIVASGELGLIPFRDFYNSYPPGHTMLTRALAAIQGNKLIVFWSFGALVQIAGAVALYLWLCRIVQPAFSAFAVVVTFVFASGDIADYPYFYHHLVVTYCLLGAWAAALACEAVDGKRRFLLAFVSGLLLGWACTVKQTNGVISLVAVLAVVSCVLWTRRDGRGFALILGGLILGTLAPIISTFVWLERNGVLEAFIEQAVTKGPSSKGGLIGSLIRPISLTLLSHRMTEAAAWALGGMGLGGVGYLLSRHKPGAAITRWYWLATALTVPAIVIGRNLTGYPTEESRIPVLALCYLSLSGCLLTGTVLAFRLLVLRKPMEAHHPLLAAIGFSSAYALSMSWPAFEIMILPGLTYLLAASLQRVSGNLLAGGFRVAAILVCLVIVGTVTWRKHMIPQTWGRWVEPTTRAIVLRQVWKSSTGVGASKNRFFSGESISTKGTRMSSDDLNAKQTDRSSLRLMAVSAYLLVYLSGLFDLNEFVKDNLSCANPDLRGLSTVS